MDMFLNKKRHCLLTNSLDSNSKSINAHELTFRTFVLKSIDGCGIILKFYCCHAPYIAAANLYLRCLLNCIPVIKPKD